MYFLPGGGRSGAGVFAGLYAWWQRLRAEAVVRFALAAILLTAAALKTHQLATEPFLGTRFLDSRWILVAVIEFELFLGFWLASGLSARVGWWAATGTFAKGRRTGRASSSCLVVFSFSVLFVVGLAIVPRLFVHRVEEDALDNPATPDNLVRNLRPEPLSIVPLPPTITLNTDWKSIDVLTKRVWPRRYANFAAVLHALETFEPGCRPPDASLPSLDELRSVVLEPAENKAWFNGEVSLVETGEGLRYVSSPASFAAAAAHPDQALSVLAGLGVRADCPIETPSGRQAVKDVLKDALANFHPDGELEWTATALALYLPPRRSWENKVGANFDFDWLATKLVARPLSRTACRGAHTLYALAVLYRADSVEPILSTRVRAVVESFLRRTVGVVTRSSMPNGAFRPGWYHELLKQSWYWDLVEKCDDGLPDALRSVRGAYETSTVDATVREGETFEDESLDTVSTLVHVTGHHLEWMVMLPRELQPDAAVIERAVSFCAQSLRVAGTEELSRHNCPYNHAARMVRLFGTTANQS